MWRSVLAFLFSLALASACSAQSLLLDNVGPAKDLPTVVAGGSALTTATSTTFSVASIGIGTANSGRYVLFAIYGPAAAPTPTVSAFTVNGSINGTVIAGPAGFGASKFAFFAVAQVPTGTTASLSVTGTGFGTAASGFGVYAFAINDLSIPFTKIASTQAQTATSPQTVGSGIASQGGALEFYINQNSAVAPTFSGAATMTGDTACQAQHCNAGFITSIGPTATGNTATFASGTNSLWAVTIR